MANTYPFPSGSRGLVTGAGGGIGSAIAAALASSGVQHLALLDRDEAGLKQVAESIEIASPTCRCEPRCVDLADRDQVASFLKSTATQWDRLDVLVNNAGVLIRRPLDDPRSVEDYDLTMRINVDAPFELVNGLLEPLAHARGSVVNIASICAERSIAGEGVYSVSKAAIAQLTRSLAVELAPRFIRVNSVAPGIVRTQMTQGTLANPVGLSEFLARVPMNQVAQPIDIANACVFLASSAASYVTGSMLVVDGGFLCS